MLENINDHNTKYAFDYFFTSIQDTIMANKTQNFDQGLSISVGNAVSNLSVEKNQIAATCKTDIITPPRNR